MSIAQKRNMQGQIKTFDRAEHDKYDALGKNSVLHFLNRKLPTNLRTIENSNKFGIDLITLNMYNHVVFAWEVEVRYGNWSGDTAFPFDKINCIERKDYQWRKDNEFIQKIPYEVSPECVVYYVQLNKPCTRAVFIKDKIILDHELVLWHNRKSTEEYVRQVPIEKTKQVVLKD